MRLRNQRFKHLLVLVIAQAGCLAVGLWIHYHFTVSVVWGEAKQEALADLAADTEQLFTAASRLELAGRAADPASLRQIRNVLEAEPLPDGVELTLVDSRWRTVEVLRASDGSLSGEPPGQTLSWTRSSEEADSNADRINGLLAIGDGSHVAVACRLNDSGGYLVAHVPLERVEVSPAVLADRLPAAGLITLIWTCAVLGVAVYMILTRFYDELSQEHSQAEAKALRRIQSLARTRNAFIFGLAKLSESRDQTTGHHLERITAYAFRLAAAARQNPKYRDAVTSEFIQLIGISSALHDVGKVGIEDSVLLKPGPLSKAERVCMQQHTTIGGKCLLGIERRLGTSNFLQMAREIALSHHEYWDGAGYPAGLAGDAIPLAARIVAIVDVYDALSSTRVYKKAWPHEECVALIRSEAGKRFDPDLVEAFLKIEASFRRIARQYGGGTGDGPEPIHPGLAKSDDRQGDTLTLIEAALNAE